MTRKGGRQRCARWPDCPHFKPCPVTNHRSGWHTSSRRMPGNWKTLVKGTKDRVRWQFGRLACERCKSTDRLEVDHIVPHSKGGQDVLTNLQLLCKRCHMLKSARDRFGG